MAKKKVSQRTAAAKPTKKAATKKAATKKAATKKQVRKTATRKTAVRKKAARKRVAEVVRDPEAEQWIAPASERTSSAYDRHKQRTRRRQKEISESGRDIADDMPVCTDLKLRRLVTSSLRKFCERCLSDRFTKGWSADHLTALKKMERAILEGDNFAIAMPRGTGKTTMVIAAVIWSILCGHKAYVALIGADRDAASKLLDGIKVELETNDVLLDLFPEAIHPIRRLEGIANRCRGQTYQGNRTYIKWTAKHIQFAAIPKRGEVGEGERTASSAIIETAGITGKIRGMQQALPTGAIARPDCFVVDDPQTDSSAASRKHVHRRLNAITGTCPGLAGPGESISGFVTCTVIEPDDVADQLLNPEKFPDFHGERFQLVYEWPTDTELWEEYGNIYRESMALQKGMGPCNAFVKKHWDTLHAGSRVAWEIRKRKDEISPLQHAYNLLLRLGDTFWKEYQNQPKSDEDSEDLLTVDQIRVKTSGYPQNQSPPMANLATAFIDVQGNVLFYSAIAIAKRSFDCWLLDYGTWPRQRAKYYSKSKLGKRLSDIYPGRGLEGRIRQGIMDLVADLATRDYHYPDGSAGLRISRLGIDAAWGKTSTIVYACALESPHRSILLPTFGRGLDASKLPMEFWTPKPGEQIGVGYSIRPRPGGGHYGLLDSNYWKSFLHSRLATPAGDRGSFQLFEPESVSQHQLYAEHMRSETRSDSKFGSRIVPIWEPTGADNDLLDATAGALAMAGIEGATLADLTVRATRRATKKRRRPTTLRT